MESRKGGKSTKVGEREGASRKGAKDAKLEKESLTQRRRGRKGRGRSRVGGARAMGKSFRKKPVAIPLTAFEAQLLHLR